MTARRTTTKTKHPSEDDIQAAYFHWCDLRSRTIPELKLAFHIPNGTHKSMAARMKFKRLGLKPGVPDVCVPVEGTDAAWLWIEFKSHKGKVSEAQADWHHRLMRQGHNVIVSKDWTHAANETLKHLGYDEEFDEEV